MLTENQINLLSERIYQRLNQINTEYLKSIGRVIKKIGELRPSDVHKLQQMYNYGADVDEIARDLAAASEKNVAEIYEMFDIVAKENYDYSKPFYKAKGIKHVPYEQNERLKTYVKSLAKQTVDEYINVTQHTAFAVFDKSGKSIAPLFESNKNKVATSLSDTYTKLVDYAVTKAQLGETSYQSAVCEIVDAMAKSGIRTVDYATGYSRRLDTAVRQNVLWGIKECNQNVADFVGKEFGADGYEISYHSHPRESHADMAGKQFAIGKARTVNGVYYPSFEEEAEPLLKEFGCLHFKFSILLGISHPAYSQKQLEEFKANDKKKFEFEGKQYTMYEGTQLQRQIETEIRHQKDRAILAKEAGEEITQRQAQERINQLTNKYAELSQASGLPTKIERMQVKGFRSVKVPEKMLTNDRENSIIINRNIVSRGMANGNRNSPFHILTMDEIEIVKREIRIIGADETVFRFNMGYKTSYVDRLDIVQIKGDIFPDKNSIHPRDLMSVRAVIAHEYYGHRTYRNTEIKEGSWNDEFRASYIAAKITPNLSEEDRRYLILDALERAKESGINIRYNNFIRRILYGY